MARVTQCDRCKKLVTPYKVNGMEDAYISLFVNSFKVRGITKENTEGRIDLCSDCARFAADTFHIPNMEIGGSQHASA